MNWSESGSSMERMKTILVAVKNMGATRITSQMEKVEGEDSDYSCRCEDECCYKNNEGSEERVKVQDR